MSIKVFCNMCKDQFELPDVDKEYFGKLDKDHVYREFFTCPACGHKYYCFYTSRPLKNLQAKFRRLCQNQEYDEAAEIKERIERLVLKYTSAFDTED